MQDLRELDHALSKVGVGLSREPKIGLSITGCTPKCLVSKGRFHEND